MRKPRRLVEGARYHVTARQLIKRTRNPAPGFGTAYQGLIIKSPGAGLRVRLDIN